MLSPWSPRHAVAATATTTLQAIAVPIPLPLQAAIAATAMKLKKKKVGQPVASATRPEGAALTSRDTAINDDNNDKIRVAWQNTEIALMPGDSVVVKEKTSTIFVTGSVYNPGVLEFRKGKSLRFYLNGAGGLTDGANEKGIVILYANGIVSPKKWYSSPSVLEGSTIIVNQKAPEEPFDITQFATNWTSIISSVVTILVLSKQLQTY